jgi:hypothetical protein
VGALLVFQPAGEEAPAVAGWERARTWIAERCGLPPTGEADGRSLAAKFGRRDSAASDVALSPWGWLVSAGTWSHPGLPALDDSAGLLGLAEQHGAGALAALDGMFAVAWHDARDGTLTIAVDPPGRLRTAVAEGPEGLFVSTSAAALGAALGRSEPDPLAAWEVLATGTLREGRTPFSGVRLLEAGKIHRFRGGRPAGTIQLPPLEPEAHEAVGPEELAERVLEAYDGSCRRLLAAFPRPLVDLTGGLDSRLVVGLLARAGGEFDVTVSGREDEAEVRVARALARRLGLRMLVVPQQLREEAPTRFERVLEAARLCDGAFDAAEYAAAVAVHARHTAAYDASVNGSGGALLRNYWWGNRGYRRADGDAVSQVARHLAAASLDPSFLAADEPRDASRHLRGVVERALEPWAGRPLHSRLDHALLSLRIGCWQGAFASATNRVWPTISPLLWREPLGIVLGADPAARAGGRLVHALLERMPAPYRHAPLATGFPPARPQAGNLWRFVPGLAGLPGRLLPRVRYRLLGPPHAGPERTAQVRALMASGAADWLEPDSMALRPLLDARRYSAFLERARTAGDVPLALLGRLVALEEALR